MAQNNNEIAIEVLSPVQQDRNRMLQVGPQLSHYRRFQSSFSCGDFCILGMLFALGILILVQGFINLTQERPSKSTPGAHVPQEDRFVWCLLRNAESQPHFKELCHYYIVLPADTKQIILYTSTKVNYQEGAKKLVNEILKKYKGSDIAMQFSAESGSSENSVAEKALFESILEFKYSDMKNHRLVYVEPFYHYFSLTVIKGLTTEWPRKAVGAVLDLNKKYTDDYHIRILTLFNALNVVTYTRVKTETVDDLTCSTVQNAPASGQVLDIYHLMEVAPFIKKIWIIPDLTLAINFYKIDKNYGYMQRHGLVQKRANRIAKDKVISKFQSTKWRSFENLNGSGCTVYPEHRLEENNGLIAVTSYPQSNLFSRQFRGILLVSAAEEDTDNKMLNLFKSLIEGKFAKKTSADHPSP